MQICCAQNFQSILERKRFVGWNLHSAYKTTASTSLRVSALSDSVIIKILSIQKSACFDNLLKILMQIVGSIAHENDRPCFCAAYSATLGEKALDPFDARFVYDTEFRAGTKQTFDAYLPKVRLCACLYYLTPRAETPVSRHDFSSQLCCPELKGRSS